ncbi:PREDICTED: lys-63-specific deubiquitinase BRCC36-like [Papilio xuthus]|uniref:Lys-63-specific deubiquitinase BRCC36-like n=1 Tax=Papilio xuthus TaxID=66420 RepID=A0A194PDN5_PAPXU|nr:PREDICTED: lys-63-specific deubiquitinase BRCC36-like [Papilio xuthus]KPI91461.1 Lys-63-specific deubiquitinase BRCC36-like [Papilio xuthus]
MLNKVLLSTDVTLACVQHALSTEKEEIMGLLIGEVHDNSSLVSIVSSVILRRLDKKPDRVEISEEQLVQATLRAEELAAEVGRPLRVVGWYHSHPHITVWPSHVDLATQSMYQRMDSSFVGIIFAVFLTEQTAKAPSIQITCFQSVNEGSNQSRREIELEITNNNDSLTINNFEILTQLPAILKEEEDESYSNEVGLTNTDDIITKQHNAAVRTIAIGHIVEKVSRPMLEALVARNALYSVRLRALNKRHQELMSMLDNMSCNV